MAEWLVELRLCTPQPSFQPVAGGALFKNFTRFLDNDGSCFRGWQAAGVDIRDDSVFETNFRVTAKLGRFHLNRWIGQAVEDRKSTRLNSSHTVISYAVFCLKKKKKRKYI